MIGPTIGPGTRGEMGKLYFKMKNFCVSKVPSWKWKHSPQNESQSLKIVYQIRDLHPEHEVIHMTQQYKQTAWLR